MLGWFAVTLTAGVAHAQSDPPRTPSQWMLPPGPPHDGIPLERTNPGHLGPGPVEPRPRPAIALPLPPPYTLPRIVYAFAQPATRMMVYSKALSAACRRGRFIQRINLLYRAFGPKESPLGVAYGTWAINLVDPDRQRQMGEVYFFDRQDTGLCAVYTAQQTALLPWYYGPGGGYGRTPAGTPPGAAPAAVPKTP
ncbi:MAG: hypothetical protein PW843_24010 [Azospirillaceae bacterium]|nr:hypothetical protein [Azospirillaceae bacterium]